MSKSNRTVLAVVLLTGLCSSTASLAASGDPARGVNFEIFAGSYQPKAEEMEDDVLYGLRLGHALNKRFEVEGTFGRFENSSSLGEGVRASIDSKLVDASGLWVVPVRDKVRWLLFGGPGWAFGDAELTIAGQRVVQSTDSLSMHAGTGLRLALTRRAHIRPDARFRWYEQTSETDFEATVAAGLAF